MFFGLFNKKNTNENHEYLLKKAVLKIECYDYEGSILDLKEMLKIFPNDASIYYLLASSEIYLGKFNEAISNLTKSIKIRPDMPSYLLRGIAKSKIEDNDGAMSDFNMSIEIYPDKLSYFHRGILKYDLRDYNGAISDLTKSIELESNSNTYIDLAFIKYHVQDYKGAILDLTKSIEIAESAVAYINRARAKSNLGDYNGAILDFTKALVFDEPRIEPNYKIYKRRPFKTFELFGHLTSFASPEIYTKIHTYRLRADAKCELNDFDGSISDITKAIELDDYGNYYNLYIERAVLKNKCRNFEGAINDRFLALKLNVNPDDDDYENYAEIALLYLYLHKYDESICYSSTAINIDTSNERGYCIRAVAKYKQNDMDGFIQDKNSIIELYGEKFANELLDIWLSECIDF
jgi:tetratricopeptide (TPR) repeat protein